MCCVIYQIHILADLPKPPEQNHLWVMESQLYTNTYCIVATVGLFKVVTRSGRGQDYNYPHTFKTTWYVYTTHNYKHCQALTLLCFLPLCRGDRTRKSERHAVDYTTHLVYLANMPHATTHTNATHTHSRQHGMYIQHTINTVRHSLCCAFFSPAEEIEQERARDMQ